MGGRPTAWIEWIKVGLRGYSVWETHAVDSFVFLTGL
jgi:hypothetical protein